jgi:cysteinyl-tRNA synthetase
MPQLKLKNSLTKSIEPFEPLDPSGRSVSLYSCGPTVYSHQHIGNFRSFLLADLLRRVLELHGYQVRHVMNITDVGHMTEDHVADASGEDKLSKAARELGSDPYTVARHFEAAFAEDAATLRLKIYQPGEAESEAVHPRATRHVPEMLAMIQTLLDKGYAYTDSQGQVYFAIAKFAEYGQLSGKVLDELEAGSRVAVRDEKKDPRDFALWKVDDKHLMKWDPHGPSGWEPSDYDRLRELVPQGVSTAVAPGFPGWHIECSAMANRHLGALIDIHTGGEDNVFPHHECEIAQSYGAFATITTAPSSAPDAGSARKSFARYWVHGRHLLVNHHKMSKREGTLFTIRDLTGAPEGKSPELKQRFADAGFAEARVAGNVLRYALMSNPYTQPMNFSFDLLVQASASVQRLQTCFDRLRELTGASAAELPESDPLIAAFAQKRADFLEALDDNLNVANALSVVFAAVSAINQNSFEHGGAVQAKDLLEWFDLVFDVLDRRVLSGLVPFDRLANASVGPADSSAVVDLSPLAAAQGELDDATIERWLALRYQGKKARNFKLSDQIRDGLKLRAILIEDVADGVRWKRKG